MVLPIMREKACPLRGILGRTSLASQRNNGVRKGLPFDSAKPKGQLFGTCMSPWPPVFPFGQFLELDQELLSRDSDDFSYVSMLRAGRNPIVKKIS